MTLCLLNNNKKQAFHFQRELASLAALVSNVIGPFQADIAFRDYLHVV